MFNLKSGQLQADQFEDNPVITVTNGSMHGLPILIKRGLDVFFSLIVLIALTPSFFIVALLIKLTSPGPVFFVQDRIGLNKRRLRLYKFRTMVFDAEKRIRTGASERGEWTRFQDQE
jgi:lipopolysaccharide/colanic/teichoic acid biosynthesis glycosyltransferase